MDERVSVLGPEPIGHVRGVIALIAALSALVLPFAKLYMIRVRKYQSSDEGQREIESILARLKERRQERLLSRIYAEHRNKHPG